MRSQTFEKSVEERVKFLVANNLDIVTDSLYNYLQSVGVLMLTDDIGDDFQMQREGVDTVSAKNIIGIIPGYDPALKDEYILLGAQYDRFIKIGAHKNASGMAALAEIARLISENKFVFRRSVIIALFGAGDLGNAGSWYFINRSFSEPQTIKYMIELNSLGRGGQEHPFQIFPGVPTPEARKTIAEINERPFSLQATMIEKVPFNSDFINFYDKNIPITLCTTGPSRFDRTNNDISGLCDYFQLSQIVEWVYSYALLLANREESELSEISANTSSVHISGNIYTQSEVEKRATYMRGDERTFLKEWVYKYISYPDSALDVGTQGIVEAEFVVDNKGEVCNVEIVKSVTEALDNEVVKVIKASPKWKPASIGGQKVSVKIRVAVEFRATKDGKIGLKW